MVVYFKEHICIEIKTLCLSVGYVMSESCPGTLLLLVFKSEEKENFWFQLVVKCLFLCNILLI